MDFPGGLAVKNTPTSAGDTGEWVWSLGPEDPLEKEMATHSSILAWEINLMDRGAWGATVVKSHTRPSD